MEQFVLETHTTLTTKEYTMVPENKNQKNIAVVMFLLLPASVCRTPFLEIKQFNSYLSLYSMLNLVFVS